MAVAVTYMYCCVITPAHGMQTTHTQGATPYQTTPQKMPPSTVLTHLTLLLKFHGGGGGGGGGGNLSFLPTE